jgi:hypothetical protein
VKFILILNGSKNNWRNKINIFGSRNAMVIVKYVSYLKKEIRNNKIQVRLEMGLAIKLLKLYFLFVSKYI